MNNKGKLIIVSAPSGAGKTTIVNHLIGLPDLGLEFSVSATSREKRAHEINGEHYYFLSTEDFIQKINNKEFVEWEEVYPDQFYGTLSSEVERIWEKGHHVIFDVDVIGGLNLKKQFSDRALSVFIQPPSLQILEERLRSRSTENEKSLVKRIQKAKFELSFASQFDQIILNDHLETALSEAQKALEEFLSNS